MEMRLFCLLRSPAVWKLLKQKMWLEFIISVKICYCYAAKIVIVIFVLDLVLCKIRWFMNRRYEKDGYELTISGPDTCWLSSDANAIDAPPTWCMQLQAAPSVMPPTFLHGPESDSAVPCLCLFISTSSTALQAHVEKQATFGPTDEMQHRRRHSVGNWFCSNGSLSGYWTSMGSGKQQLSWTTIELRTYGQNKTNLPLFDCLRIQTAEN